MEDFHDRSLRCRHLEADLAVSAFLLVRGLHLMGLVPSGGRYLFEFDNREGRAEYIIREYREGAVAPAKELFAAERDLKNQLYALKGQNYRYGYGNSRNGS